MQTFLPLPTYEASARALDQQRLGKQRVEAFQMASAILDPKYGWQRHPAVEMWRGHGAALCVYGMVVCRVWRERGFKDTMLERFIALQYLMTAMGERIEKPKWIGDENLHRSHRSNLVRKDPGFYSFFNEPPDLEYIWPDGMKRSGVRAEVRQKVANSITCRGGCGGRKGFSNRGDGKNQWWVCSQCGLPTEQWLRAQGDDVLNMFCGGPIDGYVYTTTLLLSVEGLRIPVAQYVWTPEIIVSEKTGRAARVWRFQPGEGPGNVALAGNTTIPISGAVKNMSETPESTVNHEAAAAAPVSEPIDTADLRPRREALKASRTQVAVEAGVTVAQLYRIETGGKRTTAEEAKTVRDAIERLERNAADVAAAQTPAQGAGAPDPS
jgi:hypothetical protein